MPQMNFDEIKKTLLRITYKVSAAMLAILAANGKQNTKLYQSFKNTVEYVDGKIKLIISMSSTGKYVEDGRMPYPTDKSKWPPIEPIRIWKQSKGLNISEYAIRASIGIKGIKPIHFMDPWKQFSSTGYKDEIAKAYKVDILSEIKRNNEK